jgi:hypothetical protein
VRGDTFVVKTNIHYPTDANLLADGLRKILKFRPPDIPPKSPCFLEVLAAPFDETCKRFF